MFSYISVLVHNCYSNALQQQHSYLSDTQPQTFIFLLKDLGLTGWDQQGLAPGCRLGPNLFGLAGTWGLPFSWQIMQVSRAYQPVQAWKSSRHAC